MRLRLPTVALAVAASLVVAAAPAHAETPRDQLYALAHQALQTADDTVAATCAAVERAEDLLRPVRDVTGPVAPATSVSCPREALEIVDEIEGEWGWGAPPTPMYVVVLKRKPVRLVVPGGDVEIEPVTMTSTPDGAAFVAWQSGAYVQSVYRDAVYGYAARMDAQRLAHVQPHADVAVVDEADKVYSILGREPLPAEGVDRLDHGQQPLNLRHYCTDRALDVTA